MKKILFAAIVSSLILAGCSSTNVVKQPNVDRKITWETAGHLPAQKGYEKNIGTAGVLYGSLEGKYVVVGGGANFPIKPTAEGGPKVLYSDVYVLTENNGQLEVVEHTNLPHEIGYGASVTTDKGIYYIGGAAQAENDNDIWFLSMKDGKLNFEKVGDLPFTFQNGGAVEKDGKLYVHTGKQAGQASNKFYSYDLATQEVVELAPVPGETRTQAVSQLLNGELYVFSGGNSKAFVDGYKYNFDTNTWTEVAPVVVNGKEVSLLGANSVKLNESEMMVIGGFEKQLWNDANYYLGNLKGDELAAYKAKYFGADPAEFGWNREILVYNAETNSWKTIGEIPFDAPCGEGLVLLGNKVFSINGEIKPGVRTDRMYTGTIIKK
ncbi:cyclically-permuted mutarotase family protein [uncultured Fusobacterium sp.]|uniref:cyclically-permuted mutarotase family protein n=1 Tax=uncultured Fusobacterium sp. TaxID=159267 RepID=UPI0025FEBBE6|nr:cyclically-permuted mutarotase family protein [uncultured Fusobacterium sp.]